MNAQMPTDRRTDTWNVVHAITYNGAAYCSSNPDEPWKLFTYAEAVRPQRPQITQCYLYEKPKSPQSRFVVARGWGEGEMGREVLMVNRFLEEVTEALWN